MNGDNDNLAKQFTDLCLDVIAKYKSQALDSTEAAKKISDFYLGERRHPMLYEIQDLAEAIADDYHFEGEHINMWRHIVNTITAYNSHDWQPTYWLLAAIYGRYEGSHIDHSYSINITRQNGQTTVETGNAALRTAIEKSLLKVSEDQTDEWYLRNICMIMPNTVSDLVLLSVRVIDRLAPPLTTR